jgi:hypothetical protein
LKFFFDNNLSPYIARALHVLNQPIGHSVVALRDKFPQNVSDIEWIEGLAKEGDWVAFTADYDIVRQGAIKVAWKKAGLVGFVLRPAWKDFPPIAQASKLLARWPQILEQAKLAAPGSTYELGIKAGKIHTL